MFFSDCTSDSLWSNPANRVLETTVHGETIIIARDERQLYAAKYMDGQFAPLILSGIPTRYETSQDMTRTYALLKSSNLQLVGSSLEILPRMCGGAPTFPEELLNNLEELKNWFQKNPNFTRLQIEGCTRQQVTILATALPFSHVVTLQLCCCGLTYEEVKVIAATLPLTRVSSLTLDTKDTRNTALHVAVEKNDRDLVALLLQYKATLLTNLQGETPLDLARRLCHHDLVELLEGSVSTSTPPPQLSTSQSQHAVEIPKELCCPITGQLMLDPVVAADERTYEREAIEAHLKTEDTSPVDKNILEHKSVISDKFCKKKIEKFITKNPQLVNEVYFPNAAKESCLTALANRDVNALKELLQNNPRFLAIKFPGGRLIELACETTPELLKTVIEAYQERPHFSHTLCAKAAEGLGVEGVKLLFDLLSKTAPSPDTALFEAVQLRSGVYLSTLLEMGINVNSKDSKGSFLLHHAIEVGDRDIITVLVEHDANIKAADSRGYNPIQYADEIGKPHLVRHIKQKRLEIKVRPLVSLLEEKLATQEKRYQEIQNDLYSRLSKQENLCNQLQEKTNEQQILIDDLKNRLELNDNYFNQLRGNGYLGYD